MHPHRIQISDLEIGMKVRLKDQWPSEQRWWNGSGYMDHWLGKIVTISDFAPDGQFIIEEDDRDRYSDFSDKWYWRPSVIAEIIEDSFEPEGDDAFLRLIGGGQ